MKRVHLGYEQSLLQMLPQLAQLVSLLLGYGSLQTIL